VLGSTLFPASACTGKTSIGCAIPNLYGPHRLALPTPAIQTTFVNSVISNFSALNTEVATQLTLLPLASPASAFTYSVDMNTGVIVRSAQSFGPVITERGETIGGDKTNFLGSST
jgi:hypothetical protein